MNPPQFGRILLHLDFENLGNMTKLTQSGNSALEFVVATDCIQGNALLERVHLLLLSYLVDHITPA